MRLIKLQLSNLYGIFNYTIPCNLDDRITILTAPNGYGKTIILKTIYSLFSGKLSFFSQLVFKKIIFTFDENQVIEITKPDAEANSNLIQFILKKDTQLINLFTYEEYINKQIPEEFLSILKSINVSFIQEQRLIFREHQDNVITDTIEKYAKELSGLIEATIRNYAQVSQSLDNTFLTRILKNKKTNETVKDLTNRLNLLQKKRQKLSNYGLLNIQANETKEADIRDSDTAMLSIYISDNEEKLSVFDPLINKIELFVKILNERRFYLKKIEINEEKGFIFKTDNNIILNLTELSSGEQHEVVLLYELLFKAKQNSLVLIDEPEISLHVVWQKAFLTDIEDIIKLHKIDIIIATHSPQIINERWDLTVELEGLQ